MPIHETWVPPDGGFGWVVAVLSLLLHGQTLGMMLTMSVMYVSWLEAFDDGRGATSWVMSIGVAVMFGLGPVPAALANRYGFRAVVIIGGLLTSLGYILSFFATSVTFLIITIGLITGLGCCFGYLSAVAIVSIYFEKRRSVAMGIGTSGVGIGSLVAAPLLNYLTETYGWRGALLIVGATSLHICAYGLLLRPVTGTEVNEEISLDSDDEEMRDQKQSLLGPEIKVTDSLNNDLLSAGNINEPHDTIEQSAIAHDPASSLQPIKDRRISELANGNTNHKISSSSLSIHIRINPASENEKAVRPYSSLKDLTGQNKQFGLSVSRHHLNLKNSLDAVFVRSMKQVDGISLLGAPREFLQNVDDLEIENEIHKEKKKDSPSQTDDMKSEKSHSCIHSYMNYLMDSIYTNIEILKDPMFLQFAISNIMTNLSYITPAMYLVDRAVDSGLSKTFGAMLMAFNGVGNIFGRLFFGAVTYRLFPDRLMTYIVVLSLGGIFTMISPICGSNAVLHGIYAFLIGCFIGGYACLVAVATVDIMGLSKASDSFGLLLTFMGFATLIGPPFGGVLFDETKSYVITYILYGFFLLGSVLMLLPAACIRRRKRKRKQMEEKRLQEEESLQKQVDDKAR